MKFLGGFLKFLSTLIMIIATVACILIAVDAAVIEAYLAMGLIWVCALVVAMIIWVTGSVLTTVSNLKKRTAQLEQKLDSLMLAQVSAYRMAPNPVVKNDTNAEIQIAENPVKESTVAETPVVVKEERTIAATVAEPVTDAPKKKSKKGLIFGIIGGICVICVIAVLVVIGKTKGNDPFTGQEIPNINPPIENEEPEIPFEEIEISSEESEEMKILYAEIIPNELQGVWCDRSEDGILTLYAFQDDRVATHVVNMGIGAGSLLSGTYSVESGKVKYDFGSSTGYSYFTYEDNTLMLSNAHNIEISKMSAPEILEYLLQEEDGGNNNGVICLADLIINYYGDSEECGIAIDRKEAVNAAIEAMGQAALQNLTTDYDKVQGITWYEHKNQPIYTDICCYIYPYIGRMDSGFTWLRVKLNYTDAQTDDGWIFFEKVIFSVDGTNTTKYFDRSEIIRDNDTEVWETADFEPNSSEIQLLKSIANSTETIIRFEGDEYYEDHIVTKKEKAAILDVLNAYDYLNK